MATEFRATFDAAAAGVEAGIRAGTLSADDDMLDFYGLYKAATVGKVNTERPGMLNFKGKAKWDAWKARENVYKFSAMASYIEKANAHLGVPFSKD